MARRAFVSSVSSVLLDAAFAPATLQKYNKAVSLFLSSCISLGEDPSSILDLDHLLVEYITHLYLSGGSKASASDLLHGLYRLAPQFKGRLRLASTAVRGWSRLVPAVSYPPLTWDLTALIAFRLAVSNRWLSAVATLLGFDCLLRVGELTGLLREDVADSRDVRFGAHFQGMALRLRRTKTGPNQWVMVRSPAVISLLRLVLSRTAPGCLLFSTSADTFRRHFKRACSALLLSEHYVPHSLRHGGATALFLAGERIEDILLRGRWASSKTARRYIQAGPALLLQHSVPEATGSLAAAVSPHILHLLTLLSSQSHSPSGVRKALARTV